VPDRGDEAFADMIASGAPSVCGPSLKRKEIPWKFCGHKFCAATTAAAAASCGIADGVEAACIPGGIAESGGRQWRGVDEVSGGGSEFET
jgi:hypothetical protein